MTHLFLEIWCIIRLVVLGKQRRSQESLLNAFHRLDFLATSKNRLWTLSFVLSRIWKCIVILKQQNLVLSSNASLSSYVLKPLLLVSVFVRSGFVRWSLDICGWLWIKRILVLWWMLHSLKHEHCMIKCIFVIRRKFILLFNLPWKVKCFVEKLLNVNRIMCLIKTEFNSRRRVFLLIFRLCLYSNFVSTRCALPSMRHFYELF